MDERKGFLTPEQEKKLDELIKFKNRIAEAVDGPAIQLADNQGLERLKGEFQPDQLELVYQVIDLIFEAIDEAIEPEVGQ